MRKNNKYNKAISIISGILALVLAVTAAVIAVNHYWPKKDDNSKYKNTDSKKEASLPENPIDFAALKEQNGDVCGWINFDCLPIDYPVVRAGEEKQNQSYYLRRDLEGKYSTAGTIYIQTMNSADFSDPCTVVYGHNMTNLTMFGTLKKFRDKEFFDQNEYFYIYTPGHILKYAIKSAFVYDDRHILYSFDFWNEKDFNNFSEEATNPKSLVKNIRESVEIKPDSKLVILSTCTNVDAERYLVVGVLKEDTKTS